MVSTAAADIVGVAGGAREHQRIDDDVLRRECRTSPSAAGSERCRDRQLALARERLRLQLVLVDGARPPAPRRNRCAIGQMRSNFSSPSSRLIELMMLLPWQYVSASSIAFGSVVSIITGALILRISFS